MARFQFDLPHAAIPAAYVHYFTGAGLPARAPESADFEVKKNSTNSSKPPSSDIVKKPKEKPKDGKPRKQGGQPKHPKRERPAFADDQTDQRFEAPIEEATQRAGLMGPRLTALVAYLKGSCQCSFSTIRKFIRDVLQITISRGYLAKLIAKASASLEYAYDLLANRSPNEAQLNVDETGHKDNGDGHMYSNWPKRFHISPPIPHRLFCRRTQSEVDF